MFSLSEDKTEQASVSYINSMQYKNLCSYTEII